MMKNKLFLLASCFLLLASRNLSADTQSANYQVADDFVSSGGTGLVNSASYRIEDGVLDFSSKSSVSSTNYNIEGSVGQSFFSQLPTLSSVSPGDFSKMFTDQNASVIVTAASPDGDALQYQAKQDGTTKVGAQSSNALSWALSGSDRGRRALEFIVTEQHGTVIKQQSAYVFRRPVK